MHVAVTDACNADLQLQALVEACPTAGSMLVTRCKVIQRHGWYGGEQEPNEVDWTRDNLMIITLVLTRATDFDTLAYITVHLEIVSDVGAKPAFEPQAYTGAQPSLSLAKGWLETCRASHHACQAERRSDWRPSRLLRLPTSTSQGQHPVLREARREEYDRGVEYMTLSHRWAPGKQLQLLTTNHKQLREGILVKDLKASIQHAITVAQYFGIDYIWIDTLCIEQNDDEDRGHEILEMDRVYGNSVCNVSASDADNNEEGCFYDRDDNTVKAFLVRLDADSSSKARHLIRREWRYSRETLETCVLARRAWVFQERILSPCVLHFCKQELHWECRELEASETYPEGKPEYAQWGLFQKASLKTVILNSTDSTSTKDDIARAREVWRRVVSTYTSCALTYPEDKLRALAGITYVWQKLHYDEYIAGFWCTSLLRDLLWVHDPYEDPTPPRRIPFHRSPAPSWSWASAQGPVYFLMDWYSEEADDLQIKVLKISRLMPSVPSAKGSGEQPAARRN